MSSPQGAARSTGTVGWGTTSARRLAVLLSALAGLLLSLHPATVSASDVEEVTVPTAAEAWYQSSPVEAPADLCALPCPEETAPSPYPEDTLHVGAVLGVETARTYVALDLDALPLGAEIVDGTLHLPLAEAEAGTRDPQQAELLACLASSPVEPVQGAPGSEAPDVDCGVSETAVLVGGEDRFELDLASFAEAWATGTPNFGVALLPGDGTEEQRATWRAVFHGRDRATEDAQPITAQLQVRAEAVALPAPQDPGGDVAGGAAMDFGAPAPVDSGGFETGAAVPAPATADPPLEVAQDPEAASPEGPALADPSAGLSEPVGVEAARFAYPQVWLLLLVFLVVGGLLGRSLTEDYELPPAAVSAA